MSEDRFENEDVSLLQDLELEAAELPAGVDRRAFLMRSAVAGAVAVTSGTSPASAQQAATSASQVPANRRVDFDTTVNAMALTAREMNSKYKETSEGGLAVSVVLC